MSVGNFFYHQQIHATPPKVLCFLEESNYRRQLVDLVSFSYEEGCEYYNKALYPATRSVRLKSFRDFNLLSKVTVDVFYTGSGDQGLTWYNAHDRKVSFTGYVADKTVTPPSIKNPGRLISYQLKESRLDQMDRKLTYKSGNTLESILQKSPYISAIDLPLNPVFRESREEVELRKILEQLEEYLYFKQGGNGILFFDTGTLRYVKQDSFIELTGNGISNSLQIREKEKDFIKAIYLRPEEEDFQNGAFHPQKSLSKNADGTYKNLQATGHQVVNDRNLIDINVGKIIVKENNFVAANEQRGFLTALRDRETEVVSLTLNPFIFDIPLSSDVHFFHENLRFKAMVFKKQFSLDLDAKKLALTLNALKYSEAVEKLPLEGQPYDKGLVYAF